jgi:LPS-assembly lipoprotein
MQKITVVSKNLIIALLSFSMLACGYKMRKAIELPEELKSMYVQGASGALRKEIKRVLKSSDGKLVKSADEAGMIINILEEDLRRNVLSLSNTGKATEYELYYTLVFELLDAEGKVVLRRQTIEISRDYFNDQSGETVLGKASEEAVIREEMYKKVVRSVVDRARSALKIKAES